MAIILLVGLAAIALFAGTGLIAVSQENEDLRDEIYLLRRQQEIEKQKKNDDLEESKFIEKQVRFQTSPDIREWLEDWSK